MRDIDAKWGHIPKQHPDDEDALGPGAVYAMLGGCALAFVGVVAFSMT